VLLHRKITRSEFRVMDAAKSYTTLWSPLVYGPTGALKIASSNFTTHQRREKAEWAILAALDWRRCSRARAWLTPSTSCRIRALEPAEAIQAWSSGNGGDAATAYRRHLSLLGKRVSLLRDGVAAGTDREKTL
jgi:hypothetical protein